MMAALIRRAEQLAAQAQEKQAELVAARLRSLFGDAAVETQGARVLVRGRRAMKRWLVEPGLRFLGGGSQ